MTGHFDLDVLRADTAGTVERVHLNNAGAGLMPGPVVDAIQDHLELEARIGGYEAADLRRDEMAGVYTAVAKLLNCDPANVAITEHATAAFVAALSSIPFRSGDVILTTRQDYVSNQIQYLSLQHRFGVEIVRAPDAPEGGVDVKAMEGLIHRRRPRLVAVTHVPTSSGLVQDVESIGRFCRARDVLYLVDACQSVGQMPVDPDRMGCDFMAVTARKFLRGPRGVGFLYVSDRALNAGLEPLFPDLRGADWLADDLYQPSPYATRFESWEYPWALVLGSGVAARYASEVGMGTVEERVTGLAGELREGLARIPGVTVLDRGKRLCGIVTAALPGLDPVEAVSRLRTRGINTSAVDRSSAVLDFDEKGVEAALRVSPHYYNTENEIDLFLAALAEVLVR